MNKLIVAGALIVVTGGCIAEQGDEKSSELEEPATRVSQTLQLSNRRHRITGGANHSLAIRQDGTVWVWGYNGNGQLGNGTTSVGAQTTPIQVADANIINVVSVAAGGAHSMALKSDGRIWAWGFNYYGQLGDGSVNQQTSPKKVVGPTDVVSIAAGQSHSLALRSDGTVYAWGSNSHGQLGIGSTDGTAHVGPEQVTTAPGVFLTGVVAIAAGVNHSLALKFDGSVHAWGYNYYGQVGNGTSQNSQTRAVKVENLGGFAVAIGGGHYHSAALLSNGSVRAWGYNVDGQLGNNTNINSNSPVPVVDNANAPITDAKAIAVGYRHTLALRANGTAVGWGQGTSGQLGNNSNISSKFASPVATLSNAEEIASGAFHSIAISSASGGVKSWGANVNGELGNGSTANSNAPTVTLSLSGMVEAAAGDAHTTALKWDGTVWSWGQNTQGQLGDGSTVKKLTPSQVRTSAVPTYLDNVTAISSGSQHTIALKADGTVWAWGDHDYGQCGNGPPGASNNLYAVQVRRNAAEFLTGIVAIAAGNYHSLALRYNGEVWAWGKGGSGQLGLADGAYLDLGYAAKVASLPEASVITAGGSHSLAVTSDGSVYTWGLGSDGQLCDYGSGAGYMTDTISQVPDVTTPTRSVVSAAAGVAHTLMLMSDGTAFSCGDGQYGQLGHGSTVSRNSPGQVPGLNNAIRIAAGGYNSLAMYSDGSLFTWGRNEYGQLGLNSFVQQNSIVQIAPASYSNWTGIAAGLSHSIAIKPNGLIWTWGRNHQGQLGNGTFGATSTLVPTQSNFAP